MSDLGAVSRQLFTLADAGQLVHLTPQALRNIATALDLAKEVQAEAQVVAAGQDATIKAAIKARGERQAAQALNAGAAEKRAAARRDRRFAWRLVGVQAATLAAFVAAQIWWRMR